LEKLNMKKTVGVPDRFDMSYSAARWAHRGEAIRALAKEYRDPTLKKILARLAADCERLARDAEERN
jgi:hypothetical protein